MRVLLTSESRRGGLRSDRATEACAGASFPGVTYRELRDGARAARMCYSAHWRADNQNPARANILGILGDRHLLPAPNTSDSIRLGEGAVGHNEASEQSESERTAQISMILDQALGFSSGAPHWC